MKPATVVLAVAGVLLFIGGAWASVVPLRSEVVEGQTPGGGRVILTHRKNLWGKELHFTSHVTFTSEDQKSNIEGMPIADERIETGALDWSGEQYGPWTTRKRNGTIWTETTEWYLNGMRVNREEWERR